MQKFLLIITLLLFVLWSLRRLWRGFLLSGGAPKKRRGGRAAGQGDAPPLDLIRDEKTGEYRVKDD